jgi:hypothetical protein
VSARQFSHADQPEQRGVIQMIFHGIGQSVDTLFA